MRKYWQFAVSSDMSVQEAYEEMENLPLEDIQTIVQHLSKTDLADAKDCLIQIQDTNPKDALRGYLSFEMLIKRFHTNTRELIGIPLWSRKNAIPTLETPPASQPPAAISPANLPQSESTKSKSNKDCKESRKRKSGPSESSNTKQDASPEIIENNNKGDEAVAEDISSDNLQEFYAPNCDDGDGGGGEMRQAIVEENRQTRHLYDEYLKSCDENMKTLINNLHIEKIELDFVPLDILHGKIGKHNIIDLSIDELLDETKVLLSNYEICNVANILKKNSRYLVAHLLWSKIKQTPFRGEEREAKFSQYWASFDTKKFEKRTRQRYCKVGKWMMKTKWGIFLDQALGHLLRCVRDYSSMLQIQPFQEKSDELKLLVESFSSPNQFAPISSDVEQLNDSNVSNNNNRNVMNIINIGAIEPTPENLEVERESSIQGKYENDAPTQKRKPDKEHGENEEPKSKKSKGKKHSASTTVSSTINNLSEPDREAERELKTEGERALKRSKPELPAQSQAN